MLVPFKVTSRPEKTEKLADAMKLLFGAPQGLPGVIHFETARDPEENVLIATDAFADPEGIPSGALMVHPTGRSSEARGQSPRM